MRDRQSAVTDREPRCPPTVARDGERTRRAAVAGRSRAVSTAMGYALVLGIVTILLTGLTAGFAPLVANQQSAATHATLEVFGNDLAGDVDNVDHLVTGTGHNKTVVLRTRLPERIGGSPYRIDVAEANESTDANRYVIRLTSLDRETSATVGVRTRTPIDTAATETLDGGPVEIVYDGSALVVREND